TVAASQNAETQAQMPWLPMMWLMTKPATIASSIATAMAFMRRSCAGRGSSLVLMPFPWRRHRGWGAGPPRRLAWQCSGVGVELASRGGSTQRGRILGKPQAASARKSKSFRPPLRGFGESLFLCSCKEKVTKKKAGPGREPAGCASRSPALLGRVGAAHNSLRSDTWAALVPPALRCALRFTGNGKQQQGQQQQQQQQLRQQQQQQQQQQQRQRQQLR